MVRFCHQIANRRNVLIRLETRQLWVVLLCSFLGVLDQRSDASDSPTVQEEVRLVYKEIKSITGDDSDNQCLRLYTNRKKIEGDLSNALINRWGSSSRLFAFPNLDVKTFNQSIQALRDIKNETTENYCALVQTWSFITGIKVIGLVEGVDCYYNNWHLWKDSDDSEQQNPLRFNVDFICRTTGDHFSEKPHQDKTHQHIKVPDSLFSSAVFYRTQFRKKALVNKKECPMIAAEFFQNEKGFTSVSRGHALTLLNCVLRPDMDNNPCYSLGLINLLQNTAIYTSKMQGSSRLITGPCSLSSINYLGLQDGVLIEDGSYLENVIDFLFGIQFLYRGFSKKFPGPEAKELLCAEYYPHYPELLTLMGSNLGPMVQDNKTKEFARAFRNYVQGKRECLSFSDFNQLMQKLDKWQLQIPLKSLQNTETVWFDPEYDIDLSGPTMVKKFKNRISDDWIVNSIVPNQDEQLLPVSSLLRYFTCPNYQMIRKLNLSGNSICNDGIQSIIKILDGNVLRDLEELDVSNNRFSQEALFSFSNLLKRQLFQFLIVHTNYFDPDKLPEIFDIKERQKLIWCPESWLLGLLGNKKISKEDFLQHNHYYGIQ